MIEELKHLGLESYEAKVLEIVLKEKLALRELSKKTRVPFGKIYSVVKNLKEKNLIKETNSRPKLVYVENASEVISGLVKEKEEKEKRILENLQLIAGEIDKSKGRETKFFEIGISPEEKRKIQLRSFKEAESEVLQILNIYHNSEINRERKLIYEKEIEQAVKRGVIFRAIYPKNARLPKILTNLNQKQPGKFMVKRLDTDFVRNDIIDSRKVLIKLAQKDVVNSGGVLFIENKRLAENLTRIFDEFWERAE